MRHHVSIAALCLAFMVAAPSATMAEAPPPPPPPGFGPPPGHQPPPPPGGPLRLAGFLSAWETAIGIRPDQLAAWREFSDAFQAALRSPAPPPPGDVEPFAMASAIAADLSEKGKKAKVLAAAIEKLKAQLTSEQLERAKQLEPMAPPPPSPPRPPRFGGGR
jgi:hypothetical protein